MSHLEYFGLLLAAAAFLWIQRWDLRRGRPKRLEPKEVEVLTGGPYRTAAEREAIFVAAKASFEDLVLERRRFELRLRELSANSSHTGMCGGDMDYYCCRGRKAIKRVLNLWDDGETPSGTELVAAESFMEDK